MKKSKKILSLVLAVAMVMVLCIGATTAYLTDEGGNKENVFTVGNIDIELEEKTDVIGEGGTVIETEDGAKYEGVMPGDYLQKEVTVTNTGSNDAYVAVTVTLKNDEHTAALLINEAIDEYYEEKYKGDEDVAAKVQSVYDSVFSGWGINYNPRPGAAGMNDARGVIDGTYGLPEYVLKVDFAKTTVGSTVIGATNWFIAGGEKAGQYWVDGPQEAYDGYYTKDMDDYEICYTYYIDLPAGESTTLFNGLNVPAEFNAEQLKMFDGLTIDISASAIQKDNIPVDAKYVGDANGEAKTAFELLAGQLATESAVAVDATVSSTEELDAAIKNGASSIYLLSGEYNIPNSAQGKTLTLTGGSDAVIKVVGEGRNEAGGQLDYGFDGSTVTFNGVTIETNNKTYAGYARLNGVYNNCTFENCYCLNGTSVFNNCTFNVSGDQYNVWTWSAGNVSFNDCTFNSDGKALLVYGTKATDVSVTNCVFNDNDGLDVLKAAIETGNDYGVAYNINITNTVVNGFAENDKGSIKGTLVGNKNNMSKDLLNVVVDGVDVY